MSATKRFEIKYVMLLYEFESQPKEKPEIYTRRNLTKLIKR